MRLFLSPIHVYLSSKKVEHARQFAKAVTSTVNYRDSNQFNSKKIQTDHFISKLGEEAVRQVYEQFGCSVIGPDYEIYEGKNKSWEEDLQINQIPLAVKTQPKSSAQKYGLSWTFQSSERRRDPILQQANNWVCFVGCNDVDGHYNCYVYPPFQIKELVFRAPKLAKLKGKKQVVYATDFKDFPLTAI